MKEKNKGFNLIHIKKKSMKISQMNICGREKAERGKKVNDSDNKIKQRLGQDWKHSLEMLAAHLK